MRATVRRMRPLAVLSLLLLTGCAAPVAALRVHGARYAPGEAVQAELVNRSSFFDLHHGVVSCFAHLEVAQGDTWTRAPEPDHACILLLLVTAPDSSLAFAYRLHDALEAGRYRLALEVTRGQLRLFGLRLGQSGADTVLTSEPFEVRR